MPQVLVIGDDLTGSNATGARFARAGMRTISVSGTDPVDLSADALVVNTGTRHAPAAQARAAVRRALAAAGPVDLVVKRVDTTLRGNVGAEVDELLTELGTRALVVPAFPDAGRTTVGGLHLVDGVPLAETSAARDPLTPVRSSRVAAVLRAGTTRGIAEIPLDTVQDGPDAVAAALSATDAELIVCDATANAHLRTIADAAVQLTDRWLSVDTGPFGVLLASALGIAAGMRDAAPILAVVGSVTRTTRDQVLECEQVLGARFVDVPPESRVARWIADGVLALLRDGAPIAGIRVSATDSFDPETARRLPAVLAEAAALVIAEHPVGGLYATGGDIAEALTATSDGFAIDTEVLPLAVAGRLVGGPHDGLPFATKGGLIGDRGAAVACLEHLVGVAARRLG